MYIWEFGDIVKKNAISRQNEAEPSSPSPPINLAVFLAWVSRLGWFQCLPRICSWTTILVALFYKACHKIILTAPFLVKMPGNRTDFNFLVWPRDLDVTIFKTLSPLSTSNARCLSKSFLYKNVGTSPRPTVYPKAVTGSPI